MRSSGPWPATSFLFSLEQRSYPADLNVPSMKLRKQYFLFLWDENYYAAAERIFYLKAAWQRISLGTELTQKSCSGNHVIWTASRQKEYGLGEACLNRLLQAAWKLNFCTL